MVSGFGSWTLGRVLGVLVVTGFLSVESVQAQSPLDSAVRDFWAAATDEDRASARDAIVSSGSSVAEVARALRAGRDYAADVETGRRLVSRRNRDGREHPYVVYVPETYHPDASYPVLVYLHGGVMRPKRDDGTWVRDPDRFVRDDAIVAFPTSWPDSIWWQASQVEALGGLLNDLKRLYNVDENRVFLLGASDGATGAYYQAFKATTPWAGFLTFNGHPAVLANSSSEVDGEIHVPNLTNKPFFIVNGGVDRLYPVSSVQPFIDLFERAGVELDFRPQPESGHDTRWWPELSPSVDRFVAATTRASLPDRLSWQTENVEMFNRAHWIVIDQLGRVEGDRQFEGFNTLVRRVPTVPLGLRTVGELEGRGGLMLLDVGEASIVEMAGIEPNDILLSVRDASIATVDSLREALVGFSPGEELPVEVERGGQVLDLVLVYPRTSVAQARQAFQHVQPSGRLDLARDGNTVTVATEGVRRYTLLLSADQFDLSQPIRVVTNGVVSYDAVATSDLDTMLRWASVDQDRTLLFSAELQIEVGGQ